MLECFNSVCDYGFVMLLLQLGLFLLLARFSLRRKYRVQGVADGEWIIEVRYFFLVWVSHKESEFVPYSPVKRFSSAKNATNYILIHLLIPRQEEGEDGWEE
jgi:hypothetical protein